MRWCIASVTAIAFALAAPAHASTAIEYPDNGVAQFSRGGAWLVTANDPIAGYYNPAALATQSGGFQIGTNWIIQSICFKRVGPDEDGDGKGEPIGQDGSDTRSYPTVCNQNRGFPRFVPNLGFAWRVHERVGIGLTVVPPASFGQVAWPRTVTVENERGFESEIAAPQRYLSLGVQGTILYPTLAVGVEVFDDFRIGAGFVSAIVDLELQTASMGSVSPDDRTDDFSTDTKSNLNVTDFFVPGIVASAHWSATDNLEFAFWYKWFDKVVAEGALQVRAPFYGTDPEVGNVIKRDCTEQENAQFRNLEEGSQPPNCAGVTRIPEDAAKDTSGEPVPRFELTVPQEIRFGVRWHTPHDKPISPLDQEWSRKDEFEVRDPLRDDIWDIELNVTWAQNSKGDMFTIRFPDSPKVNVVGSPGGQVPANADRPTGFKDSIGIRLGGQWNVVRNKLGLRTGTWIETPAVDKEDLTVTGVPALRGGLGGGLVVRAKTVDVEVGFQHLWNKGLNNGRACVEDDANPEPIENQTGCGRLTAIAGSGTSGNNVTFDNRSFVGVNGGKVSQNADIFSIGLVSRW